ncbi:MAG: hypothetical protein P0S94_00765 [Simkaniaceae bacterium]|nr:hypothetical protein [Simkaniaceae bacterium]
MINKQALWELADFFEISSDADLVEETQKKWLRSSQHERWEMQNLSPNAQHFVLNWAERQGLLAAWTPKLTEYDCALVLGATTKRMQIRLQYLMALWDNGIRFKKIVWLTGERPLDRRVDSLLDLAKNESEAARILWTRSDLPDEMSKLPIDFISVPMQIVGDTTRRPNTKDTIVKWLETCQSPCHALFVSDQPFCGYQYSVIKACLPNSFQYDVVGPGVDSTTPPSAAVILDSLARWIYTEKKHS